MCFPLNRSLSKYTSHSEFLTPLEFVLFSKTSAIYSFTCCYSSTRCTATKQQITTPKFLMFEVPMNRCCKLFKIKKKLGLKAFLDGIQWTKKREKSVKYPCRSFARDSKKYRRTEGYITFFIKVRICCHLENYSMSSLHNGVAGGLNFNWKSAERLKPLCDFAWQNGVTGRLMIAQCCKKRKNSFFFPFTVTFFKFVLNTMTFSLIK